MIRDPSDGSVREPTKAAPQGPAPQKTAERMPSSDAASGGADTGLAPDISNRASKLDKSRGWLKNYHANKSKISPELDQAIQDELDHPPASIMGNDK